MGRVSGEREPIASSTNACGTGLCFLTGRKLFSARRAFTNFFTRAAEGGLSRGKRMVPLDTSKFLRSFLNALITAMLVGNKLQCFENAAKPKSNPRYFNIGIP